MTVSDPVEVRARKQGISTKFKLVFAGSCTFLLFMHLFSQDIVNLKLNMVIKGGIKAQLCDFCEGIWYNRQHLELIHQVGIQS